MHYRPISAFGRRGAPWFYAQRKPDSGKGGIASHLCNRSTDVSRETSRRLLPPSPAHARLRKSAAPSHLRGALAPTRCPAENGGLAQKAAPRVRAGPSPSHEFLASARPSRPPRGGPASARPFRSHVASSRLRGLLACAGSRAERASSQRILPYLYISGEHVPNARRAPRFARRPSRLCSSVSEASPQQPPG